MGLWNIILCLKLVWLLFSESGSLWVAWHHHHHLRGKSFWSIKASASDSWSWKSLLRLRALAEHFFTCSLGNGRRESFWFDSWSPICPLIKIFGENGPSDLWIPARATVASVCDARGWSSLSLRMTQAAAMRPILSALPPSLDSEVEDTYNLVINGARFGEFSTAKTWSLLDRRNQPMIGQDQCGSKELPQTHFPHVDCRAIPPPNMI